MMNMQGGLMSPPDARAQEGAPPPQDGDEASEQATPEEQKMYEAFVDNAMKLIYSPKTHGQVLKSLAASDNDVMNLANVTAQIVVATEKSAVSNGMQIPDEIVYKGGEEVLGDLATLSKEAGIHTFTDQEIERAGMLAIDQYRQLGAKAGIVDENALKSQFQAAAAAGAQQPGPDDEETEPAPDDEAAEGEEEED